MDMATVRQIPSRRLAQKESLRIETDSADATGDAILSAEKIALDLRDATR